MDTNQLETYVSYVLESYMLSNSQIELIQLIKDEFTPTNDNELLTSYDISRCTDAITQVIGDDLNSNYI